MVKIDKAINYTSKLLEIFRDRFYIELQRHPEEGGLPASGAKNRAILFKNCKPKWKYRLLQQMMYIF